MAILRPNIRLPKNLVLILLCLAAGFGGGWLGSEANSKNSIYSQNSVKYVSSESQLISKIADEVGQSVVSINVVQTQNARDIFGFSFPSQQRGAGTGFIIDSKGIVITNRHVVPAGTTSVAITMADGTKFDGVKVIGRTNNSSSLDVAF